MKKQFLMCTLVVLNLSLAACGEKDNQQEAAAPQASVLAPAASEQPAASGSKDKVEVDKGLFNNEVTIPASMLGEKDPSEIIAEAKKDGIKEGTVNDDGSITYKMSKSVYKGMLDKMEANLVEGISELKSGKDFASIKDIKHNDSFTEFTLVVDKEAYQGGFDGFAALGVALPSMYYQVFSGAEADKAKVTVQVQDEASGEVFNTVVYPDAMSK